MTSLFNALSLTAAALIILKWAAQIWLERLNLSHVRTHGGAVPDAFKGVVDETTYRKSVEYTLAKGKFDQIETSYQVAILLLILFSGVLPWAFNLFARWLGTSAWAMAVFLFAVGLALSLPSLPLAWYDQFKLEERFGFNTSTQKIWWLDRLKGLLLGIILGYPLLVLVLKFVDWTGPLWWLWAWAALLAFQSAEDVSQWLITEKLISTVPWDEAGPYLRFSVTFVAKDLADENRILAEIENRLREVHFEF